MILGIISLIICCLTLVSIVLAIVSLVLGLMVLIRNKGGKGFAIAGVSTSIAALIFGCLVLYGSTLPDDTNSTNISKNEVNSSNTQTEKETKEEITTKKPTPEEIEQEYKNTCQQYNYKDVMRKPDDYVGKKIKIMLQVSTIKNDGDYCFAYSDSDDSGYFYDDKYAVYDKRVSKDFKLLKDDVIIVYGEIKKPQKLSTLIFFDGGEIFTIDAKYIDLVDDY